MYCYVVRAKDEAGNEDTNTVEHCATTPPVVGPLSISPVSATVVALTNPDGSPADDVTFTISGGTPLYNGTSNNTALIASPGAIPGSTFTVDPDITSSTCSGGLVTLTVTDSGSSPQTTTATVDVQRPPVLFSPAGGAICENDSTCSAGTDTLTLTLQGVAPLTLASDTPSVILDPGSLSVYTYTIDAIDNSIGVDTFVLLELTDNCGGGPFDAAIMVINQDLYVDVVTGSDVTGDGSASNPFKTITHALSVTPGGETINIASGTYNAAAGEVFPLFLKNGTRLIGATTPSRPQITNFGTTSIIGGDNITDGEISNLEIYGSSGGGALIMPLGSWNFSITNCIVHGDGVTFDIGAYIILPGTGCNISDSVFYDLDLVALATEQTCVIENNEFYNNMTGIGSGGGNSIISYNLIHDNSMGIWIDFIDDQPVINNNDIYCNTDADLNIAAVITNQIDAQNNAWDNLPPLIVSDGSCVGGVDVCYTSPTPAPLTTGNTFYSGGCGCVSEFFPCSLTSDCCSPLDICFDGICIEPS
jgi:hypothetical protein